VESLAPVATGRGGGSGAGARRQAVSRGGRTHRGGAGEHRGGACERYSGDDRRHSGAPRTLEEAEAGLLQFEVSNTFPVRPGFRGAGAQSCIFFIRRVTPTVPALAPAKALLTVNSCIKVRLDLQADKSPIVVKGPFFSRVVNPRYRIRGTNV
jgi:hypothetical protein